MIPPDTCAVLFDIYGTLLDGPRHSDRGVRMMAVAASFGLDATFAIDEALDQAVSEIHRTSPEPWPEIDIRRVWRSLFPDLDDAEAFSLAIEEAIHPVEPTSWAGDLLDQAHERNLPLGIVSNCQAYTRALMARHFSHHWSRFRPELCALSYEHGIAKPDPRLFRTALAPLLEAGLQPEEVIMVGDSETSDREPAEALGLRFLGVGPLAGA